MSNLTVIVVDGEQIWGSGVVPSLEQVPGRRALEKISFPNE